MTDLTACPLCESRSLRIWRSDLAHHSWKGVRGITMVKCQDCGSLATDPLPSKLELARRYAEYSPSGLPERLHKAKQNTAQSKYYDRILDRFGLTTFEHADVADVGAGEGYLAQRILDRMTGGSLDCYDFSASSNVDLEYRGNAGGWHTADFNEPDWSSTKQYDAIFCLAILEHVLSPYDFACNLASMAKEGGSIYVVAPLAGSLVQRLMGRHWFYVAPGEHLSIPTKEGLRKLVRRLPCLELVDLKEICVDYSVRYVGQLLTETRLDWVPDFLLSVPTGCFGLHVRRKKVDQSY